MKALWLVPFAIACGDASHPSDAGTCDPLRAMPQPIQLGTVVAVGSAPDGTIYVVTRDGSDERVFVSEGDTLVRRRVLGSGFSGGLGDITDDTVSFDDAQPARLVFQSEGEFASRIALVHDDDKTFYDDAVDKTELTVLPESAVLTKPLRNLPGDIELQYAALASDGEQLIVTRPQDDATAMDFKLYLGSRQALREVPISNVSVNSSAQFDFTLDGKPGTVVFGTPLSPSVQSVLRHDDGEWPLTLLPTGAGLPAGWKFSCL